jgi:hypothetical protein
MGTVVWLPWWRGGFVEAIDDAVRSMVVGERPDLSDLDVVTAHAVLVDMGIGHGVVGAGHTGAVHGEAVAVVNTDVEKRLV